MMAGAVDRLTARLIVAWRFTRGCAFPLRGAPDWLVHDLERVAADERRLRDGHALLMSKVRQPTLDQKLQAFRPEAHGGEFPAGDEMADNAITGLRQALAGQVVSDDELNRALDSRLGQEDQASAARESAESSDMRAAAMRCRAVVLEVPMGKIKSFGPLGPQYEVGGPLRQLDDGDWLVEVVLIVGGQKEKYRLSKVLEDPDAQ